MIRFDILKSELAEYEMMLFGMALHRNMLAEIHITDFNGDSEYEEVYYYDTYELNGVYYFKTMGDDLNGTAED